MREKNGRESLRVGCGGEPRCLRIALSAILVWATTLASGCASGSRPDILVDRCTYVLEYRHPSLDDLDVSIADRRPGAPALTLRYSAVEAPERNPVTDLIHCAFDPEDQWVLERAVIGDREFSQMEITLVNAELLLFDLSRYPQRFERPVTHARLEDPDPTASPVES